MKKTLPAILAALALVGCATAHPSKAQIRARMVEIHAKYKASGTNFDQWEPKHQAEFDTLLRKLSH